MNRNCPECDGQHDCSGAWRDCLEYWKKRCLKTEAENARLVAEKTKLKQDLRLWMLGDDDPGTAELKRLEAENARLRGLVGIKP